MEFPGDFQEHFYLVSNPIREQFGPSVCKENEKNKKKHSKKMSEEQAAEATNDNSVHNEASCHARAQIQ